MDIGKAFTYVFDDEKWITKVLIGGLFSLLSAILIGIPFIAGYMVKTVKNVIDREPDPLPDWSDLGDMFTQGLMLTLAFVIYAIPMFLLIGCGIIPAVILSDSGGDAESLAALIMTCTNCIIGLYGLLLGIIAPAIIVRYAVTGEFASAFRFGEIFNLITKNIGNYIIVILLSWVASFLGSLGMILCGVGALFTGFWAYLVQAHLYGQLYLEAETA